MIAQQTSLFDKPKKITQQDHVLFKLSSGEWIPTYEIAAIAQQYNARIKELRDKGWNIINKTKFVNGVKHSWFKMENKI